MEIENLDHGQHIARSTARALLRYNAHRDNLHLEGCKDGGLHPLAVELYRKTEERPETTKACYHLVDDTFNDALDAASIFSVVVRLFAFIKLTHLPVTS